ncbi:hypothetical protein LSCM1_01871 [Leishmania martiniquensis]|uniref:Uncharacterized protein n=1 Tax=Leishmania martiniquensis TaxID=1580590 RepID=A0A836GRS4_9TRYP|nr:hypothetical protein LSCM1_01871 [Leishmania martiniquensis]
MGCASSKAVRRRRPLVEAAAIETVNELRAAAEDKSAPRAVRPASASDVNPLAELKAPAFSARAAQGKTRRDAKEKAKVEGRRKLTAETPKSSAEMSVADAPRPVDSPEYTLEKFKRLEGKRQHLGDRRDTLRSGDSLSPPADTVYLSFYGSSSLRPVSSGSARAHKSENGGEKEERHNSTESINAEAWPSENKYDPLVDSRPKSLPPLQAAEAGSSINGVTGAGTTSATNSLQERRSAGRQSSSRSNSLDCHSYALPPEIERKISPDADVEGNGGRSERSISRSSPAAERPPTASVQSERALAKVSSMSLRAPFEPYSDLGLRDVDDCLPPYEWAPRTLPVPPCDTGDVGQWVYGEKLFFEVAAAGATVSFQDPTMNMAREGVPTSEPTAAEDNEGTSPPLTLHTFYPCLPSAQWPSSTVEASVSAPGAFVATAECRPRVVNAPVQQAHSQQQQQRRSQAMYEGTANPSYSTTQYSQNGAVPRLAVPPALVDILVSEEGSYALPPPQSTLYTFYPAPSHVPTHHTCGVPDGSSGKLRADLHALSAMTTAAPRIYHDGNRSRGGIISVAGAGVGTHQYKPVTYLFDSPADDWLPSRRLPSPQRALYAEVIDMP